MYDVDGQNIGMLLFEHIPDRGGVNNRYIFQFLIMGPGKTFHDLVMISHASSCM